MGRVGLVAAFLLLSFVAARSEPAAAPRCARENFRLILDVGHSAESPGATSARGVPEFEFNLELAKLIERALEDAGFTKTVLMVSTGRSKPSMYQRVGRVNNMRADLLLSIHHDAVPDKFAEKWQYEGKTEFFSDRFKGHSIFISDENADRKSSLLFGHLLGEMLKSRGLEYTHHYTEAFMGHYRHELLDADAGVYRYDTLYLLKKAKMPAVLLEAGSIVNRNEALELASLDRQLLISGAVTEAVDDYCIAQQSHRASPQIAMHTAPQSPRRHKRAVRNAPEEPIYTGTASSN